MGVSQRFVDRRVDGILVWGMKVFPLLAVVLTSLVTAAEDDGFLPLPEGLVAFDSMEGKELLKTGDSAPFWRLAQFHTMQPNLATCGVASCVTALNSLKVERPVAANHGEFRMFTVENFFTPEVSAIVAKEKVYRSGMSLAELSKLLATFPVEVTTVAAGKSNVALFREDLKRCSKDAGEVMLVNYLRKSLGQETGGHISPIGAYAGKEDMVLILDVSTYKYPWVWVKTEKLFAAMGDNGGVSRGYVTLKAK